ncbi:hypothetical protein MCHIJ_31960 [Mycolicibacterium chitae]|uniref:Secreted protein n=1 Tax=Mycolicibacterium chitae TaxID=1792 RepID=A0A448I4Y8_MYCCI|nr:hypothetical protein [Mycolicibacterium chitae]MCV7106327.1 hypothetical protein [Mycolicibacterium chitae]BBZ03759.1 hypothetical protein MCHIJ_31960 [Mycolicibacterium chitae]VEG47414.1 Uncharacterised protein [Mycolicibacterium chitae]
MQRPAHWKVVTVGVALTGLGIVGAGAAGAAVAPAPTAGIASIEAPLSVDAPQVGFAAMNDDWTDTYWDDVSYQGHEDWTDTYWDD